MGKRKVTANGCGVPFRTDEDVLGLVVIVAILGIY